MTDVSLQSSGGETPKRPIGRWIGAFTVVAGGLAGAAAFIDNADKVGSGIHDACKFVGFCSGDETAPNLAPFKTAWMDGGSDPAKQCEPQQQAYARQYPKYDVAVSSTEAHRKDALGHVTYQYTCFYSAKANP